MRVWTKWYRMVPAQPQKTVRNEAGEKKQGERCGAQKYFIGGRRASRARRV